MRSHAVTWAGVEEMSDEAIAVKVCAIESVCDYLRERQRDIVDKLEDWDIMNPYMLGFHQGLKTGMSIAVDMVGVLQTETIAGGTVVSDSQYFDRLSEVYPPVQ